MSSTAAIAPVHVLVVEDDATVSEIIVRYLEREGYSVESVEDGETALERMALSEPDLIVLDVMLPRLSGFDVCRRLNLSRIPVIILTARGEENDRIMGLEVGADDYVVKPFSPRELVARIRSVLRRSGRVGGDDRSEPLIVGELRLDPQSRTVSRNGEQLTMTALEYDLFLFLITNPSRVFRREELLEHVWGYTFGGTPTVTVHVQRLRKKIERDPEQPRHIVTVWGTGYRFDP